MTIKPTKSSREVHRLATEMAKCWPEMREEFMAALGDWEQDMRKACAEAYALGLEQGRVEQIGEQQRG